MAAKMRPPRKAGKMLIFRRYRTDRNGQIADAWLYGYKAWPIWVPAK